MSNSVVQVTVEAKTKDEAATVQVVGGSSLAEGENALSVIVTAENGTTKTYKVSLTRSPSDKLTLASLHLWRDGDVELALTPAFAPATTSYEATVPYGTGSVSCTATTSDSKASYALVGGDGLVVGANSLKVVVSSGDGAGTLEYHLTITREADSSLISLSVQNAIGTELLSDFSPTALDYPVENLQTTKYAAVKVTPVAAPGATFKVTTATGHVAKIGGVIAVSLTEETNDISVEVSGAGGLGKTTYTAHVIFNPWIIMTSPAKGENVTSGSSVVVAGTYRGTKPTSMSVYFYGIETEATILGADSGGTWSATFDTTAIPNGNDRMIMASPSSGGSEGCQLYTFVNLVGGATSGHTVNGHFTVASAPSDGSYWVSIRPTGYTGFIRIAQEIPATGASGYDFSLTGIEDGTYTLWIFHHDGGSNTFGDVQLSVDLDTEVTGITVSGDTTIPGITF